MASATRAGCVTAEEWGKIGSIPQVVQSNGTSTTAVMSQNAVHNSLLGLKSIFNTLPLPANADIGTTRQTATPIGMYIPEVRPTGVVYVVLSIYLMAPKAILKDVMLTFVLLDDDNTFLQTLGSYMFPSIIKTATKLELKLESWILNAERSSKQIGLYASTAGIVMSRTAAKAGFII